MRSMMMVGLAALVAGCGQQSENSNNVTGQASEPAAMSVNVALNGSDGSEAGTVSISEDATGITLTVNAKGLKPGTHAVHLHEKGDCTAADFTSAGGHWNPAGAQHGRDNPMGSHLGDLANMEVDEVGSGQSIYLLTGVRVTGGQQALSDADGTALVIHEGPDDYVSDPTGNAGARVACAVLAPPA